VSRCGGRIAISVGLVLAALSCALPDYSKIEDAKNPAAGKDSGEPQAPSCSMDLEAEGACRSCIAEHCCDQASACKNGACGEELGFPLTPVMSATEKFDALAECLMENCDTEDTCNTSWGCVGKYKWPALKETHKFDIRVFNYADPKETGLPNIKVKLCESSDPGCAADGGLYMTNMTDSSGSADFQVMKGFTGFFELEGGTPLASTVQWSQPVYQIVDNFTHQALAANAVSSLAVASQFHDALDEKFKPGTGFMIARIQNCLPLRYMETYRDGVNPIARARDVRFTFTPSTGASRVYYVNDMAALDPALDRTSTRAYAGAFEVLAANITVTAINATTGRVLATGTLPIRESTLGFMYLLPDVGL
jgi:hypothetical protein